MSSWVLSHLREPFYISLQKNGRNLVSLNCSKITHCMLGLEDQTYMYKVSGDVFREEVLDFVCHHQEADTRLIWHMKHISETQPDSNVVIYCDDTDSLVFLLTHVSSFAVKVWFDVGYNNKNNRRYIDVTSLAEHFGPDFCNALPGFYAFTGCDYTTSFFRKGKVDLLPL